MIQVTQTLRSGDVQVVDVPVPNVRPRGVLVRTAYSLISAGTEKAKVELAQKSLVGKARARPKQARQVLAAVRKQGALATYRRIANRIDALQPFGYSCVGVVIACGEGAEEFQPGDWVGCAGAGYANHAEVNFVPRNLCVKLPLRDKNSFAASAFVTVGSIALHGVRQADVRLGETVAVIGLGLIGLIAVQLLKLSGCRVIGMDFDKARCELGLAFGCDLAVTKRSEFVAACTQLTCGAGVDAALLTAATPSSEPIAIAGHVCRDKGRVIAVGSVGMSVPRQIFYDKELDLRLSRSYGPGRYDPSYEEKGIDYPIGYVRWTEKRNMQAFLDLVARAQLRLDRLISHRFPIASATDAYRLITEGTEPFLGVLLEYDWQTASSAPSAATALRSGSIDQARLAAQPTTSDGTIRVGFAGAGNFAQDTLIPAVKSVSGVRLHSVVTQSGLTARSVAQRFGFREAAADATALFHNPEVDAVFVCTRHDAHARLCMEALDAGKAVFVEKPLALNAKDLDGLIAAHSSAAAPFLQVGFNRRFAPATKAVREFFAASREPLSINCRVNAGFVPSTHWVHDPETGGGRIIGEGCHFVDLLIYLSGANPVAVYAQALPDSGRYSRDNVVAQIRFSNGTIGVLHYVANGSNRLSKERIEVLGGGRAAVIDDFRRVTFYTEDRRTRIGGWYSAQDKGHRAEMQAFFDAIRERRPSPLPFSEAVTTTVVTFKILESLRTGLPVRLTPPPEAELQYA